ncbi:MAG: hypothetical protein ACFFCO_12555, partial [Promethearchaeota archaeon]
MKLQIETPSQTLKLLNLTASHSKKPKLEKELYAVLRELGIQVENDPELQPRMMMTSAAYSFN